MTRVRIKICGITNVNDARICSELGADMIGLNFYPDSPRYIEPEAARGIATSVSGSLEAVGVFVDASAGEVQQIAKAAGLKHVQLHGDISPGICHELAREFRVIRAFSTGGHFRTEQAAQFADFDVLLDAHHPELRGGTGTTCDWSVARAALPLTRFLILSGGLNAQNVRDAIATVTPHAVDVCSGVESAPGAKDHAALRRFIDAVRAAEQSIARVAK